MRLILTLVTMLPACGFSGPPLAGESETDAGVHAPDMGVPADAPGSQDAPGPSDAAVPISVTLSETTTDVVYQGDAAFCNKAGTTSRDNQWYRVFHLADFGITTDFTISSVWFATESANSPNLVDIKVGPFTGPISVGTPYAANSVTPGGSSTDAPITLTIPAGGSFIVEISSADIFNGSGNPIHVFHLGATGTGETASAYYGSGVCSTPAQGVTTQYLIDVKGSHF